MSALRSIVAFIPLLVVLPHWIGVLRSSPVDRANLLGCGTVALVLAALAAWRVWSGGAQLGRSRGPLTLALLMAVLLLFLVSLFSGIWLIAMAVAILALFVGVLDALGGRRGFCFAPAFAALLLAVPGVAFWGGRLGEIMIAEAHPALVLNVRPETPDAFPPGWLVRKMENSPSDRALFRTSRVQDWAVATEDAIVRVSEVALGEDIHEIHPPAFCFKSQGFVEAESRTLEIDVDGRRLEVSENVFAYAGGRKVVWTWYSDAEESTASFVAFRYKARNNAGNWRRYMVSGEERAGLRETFVRIIRFCIEKRT
jgi:hypothetical protein